MQSRVGGKGVCIGVKAKNVETSIARMIVCEHRVPSVSRFSFHVKTYADAVTELYLLLLLHWGADRLRAPLKQCLPRPEADQ